MKLLRAFWLGFVDGWIIPHCLSSGLTWGDRSDDAYDLGVNLGQRLRSPFRHERPR